MMRITKLVLKKYGPFEDLEINFQENKKSEFAEIQMFTGENGSGKSSVLYALTLPDNQDYIRQRCHDLQDGTSKIEIHYSKGAPNIVVYKNGSIIKSSQNKIILDEYLTHSNNQTYSHHDFTFALFSYSSYRNFNSVNITGTKELFVSPVKGATQFDKQDSKLFLQWVANMKTREANAHYKGDTEKLNKTKNSLKRIENAISGIIESTFEFEFDDDPIAVSVKVDGKSNSFDVLPDGLKSILSWIGDMLMRLDRMPWENKTPVEERNIILFLDEIDVHLHPKWQKQVLYIIQRLLPNAQIFVSTHSPFVVSSIGDAFLHELRTKEKGSFLEDTEELQLGNSYNRMVKEVFLIDSAFSPEVDKYLEIFYALKADILNGDNSKIQKIEEIALILSKMGDSDELNILVSYELRKLKKRVL